MKWNSELVEKAAKAFLVEVMSDFSCYQPSDFDDLIGMTPKSSLDSVIMKGRIPWNDTVFRPALGKLVEEGKVAAWNDDVLGWFYQLRPATQPGGHWK